MAFQFKFTAELFTDCKSFILNDTTGDYNVTTNPTGWGTPNPAKTDVALEEVIVENLTTNTTYDTISVINPSIGDMAQITTEDLLIDGVSIGDIILPDGQYCITIILTMDDDSIYSAQVRKIFLCESCCKIKKLACEIDLGCGCCNDPCADKIWDFLQANTELKIVEYSAYCSSETNLNNKIKSLQSFLTKFDCKNC